LASAALPAAAAGAATAATAPLADGMADSFLRPANNKHTHNTLNANYKNLLCLQKFAVFFVFEQINKVQDYVHALRNSTIGICSLNDSNWDTCAVTITANFKRQQKRETTN